MNIEVWGQTDVGLTRSNNQDSFLIDPELGLYIVADGMGGHQGGEVASSMAVQTVKEVVVAEQQKEARLHPRQIMNLAYKEASRRVYELSKAKSELRGMGTTMVVTLFHNDTLFIGNVGDSRAYLHNQHGFWQMTEDHSLVAEQIRAGLIKDKDAGNFMAKNIITRSVGYESDVVCDIIERRLLPNETVIVCSDGLSGFVTDAKISELCAKLETKHLVPKLIDEAKKGGGGDNVTVLAIRTKN